MSRASAIGAVIVASGILVGGSIISVYAINSSVVAEDAPHAVIQTAALVTPTSQAAAVAATTGAPTVGPEDLTVESSDDELFVPVVPDPQPAQTGANRPATSAGNAATRQRSIAATTAQRAVARATGGRLLATWATQHNGLVVYAVKVQRGDGSVVVGYVDRRNGTVVDWARISTAPAQATRPSTSRPATNKPASTKPKPSSTAPQAREPEDDEPSAAPQTSAASVAPTPTPRPTRHHTSTRRPASGSTFGFDRPSRESTDQWTPEPSPSESHSADQSDD